MFKVDIILKGRVQGVGFRYYAKQVADEMKVGGKVYYSHIVLERQTLYSICKAYNVTIDQIYEANPAVKAEGLKKNAIILIPAADRKLPRETVKETVEKSVKKPDWK